MTPDARAALAAALVATMERPDSGVAWPTRWTHDDFEWVARQLAGPLLAAMPDWVLMPRVATADWTGSTAHDDLAEAWADAEWQTWDCCPTCEEENGHRGFPSDAVPDATCGDDSWDRRYVCTGPSGHDGGHSYKFKIRKPADAVPDAGRCAARWLLGLIEDGRVRDLDPLDEYVDRVRAALAPAEEER